MNFEMTKEFKDEVERYSFIFCCEDCAHFCPDTGGCAHFFPNAKHRKKTYREAKEGERLFFCKEFETV